ncbi:MAG: hypothetical protein ACREQT_03750, partial [Candidatus Binataceae bacterium]
MRFEATDQALAQAGRLQVRLSQAMRAIESARTVVRWSRLSRRATSRLTRAVQDEARSSAFSKQIALARKLRFIGSVPRSLQPKADSGSDLTAKLNWLNRVFHSTPVLDASRGKENEAGSTISVFATLANKRAGSVVEKGSAGIRDGQFANARKHLSQLVLRLFQDNLPALLSGRQRGDSLTKAVAQGKQSDRLTGKYRFGFGKDNKVKTKFGKIASRYHPLSVSEVSTGPRIAKSFLESTVASSDALAKLT